MIYEFPFPVGEPKSALIETDFPSKYGIFGCGGLPSGSTFIIPQKPERVKTMLFLCFVIIRVVDPFHNDLAVENIVG